MRCFCGCFVGPPCFLYIYIFLLYFYFFFVFVQHNVVFLWAFCRCEEGRCLPCLRELYFCSCICISSPVSLFLILYSTYNAMFVWVFCVFLLWVFCGSELKNKSSLFLGFVFLFLYLYFFSCICISDLV